MKQGGIVVREWEDGDAGPVAQQANDRRVWLGLQSDVERIGAEVGYWLGREFWGRGIATTALRLLTAHAFRTQPELRRLYAVPYATNAASARVLEKAGYVREGTLRQSAIKDGQVLDQWMYSI